MDTDSILPPLEELTPAVPPPLIAAAGASSPGARSSSKKRKKTETGAAAPAAPPATAHVHSDSEEDSEDELLAGGYHPGRAGLHYDHAHDFKVPCNSHIIRVMELLRKEWKEVVEIVGAVKLWIQLSIPPIESGGESVHPPATNEGLSRSADVSLLTNNARPSTGQFHVGIQEEVIQELTRFEDVAYNYLEYVR